MVTYGGKAGASLLTTPSPTGGIRPTPTPSDRPPGLAPEPGREPRVYGGVRMAAPTGAPTFTEKGYKTPEEATKKEGTLQAVYSPSSGTWHALTDPLLAPGGVAYTRGALGKKAGYTAPVRTPEGVQVQRVSKKSAQEIIARTAERRLARMPRIEITATRAVRGYVPPTKFEMAYEAAQVPIKRLAKRVREVPFIKTVREATRTMVEPYAEKIEAPTIKVTKKLEEIGKPITKFAEEEWIPAARIVTEKAAVKIGKALRIEMKETPTARYVKGLTMTVATGIPQAVRFVGKTFELPEKVRKEGIMPTVITTVAGTAAAFKVRPYTTAGELTGGVIATRALYAGGAEIIRAIKKPRVTRVEVEAAGVGVEPLKVRAATVQRLGQKVKVEFVGKAPTDLFAAGKYRARVYGRKGIFRRKEVLLGEPTGVYATRVTEALTPEVVSIKVRGQPVLRADVYTTPAELGRGIETIGRAYTYPLDVKGVRRVGVGLIGERAVKITPRTPPVSQIGTRLLAQPGKFKLKKAQLIGTELRAAKTIDITTTLPTGVELQRPITGVLTTGRGFVFAKRKAPVPVDFTSRFISVTPERVPTFPAPTKFKPFRVQRPGVTPKLVSDVATTKLTQDLLATQVSKAAVKAITLPKPAKAPVIPIGVTVRPAPAPRVAPAPLEITTVTRRAPPMLEVGLAQRMGLALQPARRVAVDVAQRIEPAVAMRQVEKRVTIPARKTALAEALALEVKPARAVAPMVAQMPAVAQRQRMAMAQLSVPLAVAPPEKAMPMPFVGIGAPSVMLDKKIRKKRKPRRGELEPILTPLADPLSIAVTEAVLQRRARHLRPTAGVKKEFARRLKEHGLAFRFPTAELAKRKKDRGFII